MNKAAIVASVMLTLFQLTSCSYTTTTKVSKPDTQESEMPADPEQVQQTASTSIPYR